MGTPSVIRASVVPVSGVQCVVCRNEGDPQAQEGSSPGESQGDTLGGNSDHNKGHTTYALVACRKWQEKWKAL